MRYILLILCSVLLISCTKYHVATNTFVDSKAIPCGFPVGSSFALISLHDDHSLFSKEIGYKIEKLLEEQGYVVVEQPDADFCLEYDFDIEKTSKTVRVPAYAPGRTYISCGTMFNCRGRHAHYLTSTHVSGRTAYVRRKCSYYTREVFLTVSKQGREGQVWQGRAVSSGRNGDLREVVDYLLVSVFDYFGQNTHKYLCTEMDENDRDVRHLRDDF